jgi:RHS repeat-associated protein
MPNFQTHLHIRSWRSTLALAALLWLALLSCFSLPAPAAAQTINFEPPVYLHPDLNGNTVMASNAAGQIIWQERLEPFGRKSVLSNSAAGGAGADQGFHGKSRDEETGLIYFGARHYHPLLGRFLSMDPVEAQSGNLHSFNRYAFANNNPYKYTDPDGQIPIPIILYYGYQAAVTLTPIVGGMALRFAANRVVQASIASLPFATGEIDTGLGTGARAANKAGSIRGVNVVGGNMNCVNCAIATDATLAGRAASALPGGPYRIDVLEKTFGSKFGAPGSIANVNDALSLAGPGSRGIVYGENVGSSVGHVFNAVNQNGVVRFLDGQTGRAASLEGMTNFQLLRTN